MCGCDGVQAEEKGAELGVEGVVHKVEVAAGGECAFLLVGDSVLPASVHLGWGGKSNAVHGIC